MGWFGGERTNFASPKGDGLMCHDVPPDGGDDGHRGLFMHPVYLSIGG